MSMTRRQMLASASAATIASGLAKPAIAANDPIPIGYLPALTGPSSATGVGINRGIQLAVQESMPPAASTAGSSNLLLAIRKAIRPRP